MAWVEGWRAAQPQQPIRAYDIKTRDPASATSKHADYARLGVDGAPGPAEALAGARAVFSLVTADQAAAAARAAADHLAPGALYLDGNSCAPDTKRAAARVIEAAGGRYVDLAIMAPVRPALLAVPLLVSGPHGEAARDLLRALGMRPDDLGGAIGRASSVKMMRSVMIKGIEALTLECLLAARRAGVEQEVIASLDASMPGMAWPERATYNLERCTTHGARRAAEMHEVARTVKALGLPARMSQATMRWQQDAGRTGPAPRAQDFGARADALIGALASHDKES